jgi:hypothetical protein
MRDVGRTFGVEITVADSALWGRPITAAFSDQPLDVVLDVVTRTVGARYERTPRGIVIRSGPAGGRGTWKAARPLLTTSQAASAGQ